MNDFEKVGKQMPYKVPDGFFETIVERTTERILTSQPKRHHNLTFALAISAAITAIVLILTIPSSDPTDYRNISECESIEEVMDQMSAADLEMWAMMTYQTSNQNQEDR